MSFQLRKLSFIGVLIECLDEEQKNITGATASGFILREGEKLFLYTCWHVATGYEPHNIQVRHKLPDRRYLKLSLQDAQTQGSGVEVVGGFRTIVLPLYETNSTPFKPLWHQDKEHNPNFQLNAIGLYVPFWHDAIKLELPSDLHISDLQVIEDQRLMNGNISAICPGDKCLVVGYPFGYSAGGKEQPTPLVLTRFAASDRIAGRHQQFFLESIAAPSMSGSPVFIERSNELFLIGIYTGSLYPDGSRKKEEPAKFTDLGIVSNLSFVLLGDLPLVREPSEASDIIS